MKPLNPTDPRSESGEIQGIISKGRSSSETDEKKQRWEIAELRHYLKVFLYAIQEHHFGPKLLKLGLEFGQHGFALRTFGIQTQFNRSHWKLRMPSTCTGSVIKWQPDLCFFSLVESASGRNFSFSLDSLFQSSAAAAVPDQRKSHKIKRP